MSDLEVSARSSSGFSVVSTNYAQIKYNTQFSVIWKQRQKYAVSRCM